MRTLSLPGQMRARHTTGGTGAPKARMLRWEARTWFSDAMRTRARRIGPLEPPLALACRRANPYHRQFLDPHYVFDEPRDPPSIVS